MNKLFKDKQVKAKFDSYPAEYKTKLMAIRQLIFDTAASIPDVGEIEETLKWAEPAYITSETKSGSTIRLNWKSKHPDEYALYFNCKTTLIDSFKDKYGDLFDYSGNRSIVFKENDLVPVEELADCIAMALTYHTKGRRKCLKY